MTSRQYYKYSKAVHSSRSHLKSIAVELDKIYPIRGRESKGKRYVTIEDIFEEACENNPEPKPQFRNMYKRLNDVFTYEEWNLLEALNNDITPRLDQALPARLDGHKRLILPNKFSVWPSSFQTIATKSNVVSEVSHLIVKNDEAYDSGGSPECCDGRTSLFL